MEQKTTFFIALLIISLSIFSILLSAGLIFYLGERVIRPAIEKSSNQNNPYIEPTPTTSPIRFTGVIPFNNYKITLPKNYWAESIEIGYEANMDHTFCYPGRTQDKPGEKICHTLRIHSDTYKNIVFEIADVQDTWEKWGEHGGFIPTVSDNLDLGNGIYNGNFTFTYEATYDNPENPDAQHLHKIIRNNESSIYWIFGCVGKGLCLSYDNYEDNLDGKIGSNNIVESFKNFVNNLTIQ